MNQPQIHVISHGLEERICKECGFHFLVSTASAREICQPCAREAIRKSKPFYEGKPVWADFRGRRRPAKVVKANKKRVIIRYLDGDRKEVSRKPEELSDRNPSEN